MLPIGRLRFVSDTAAPPRQQWTAQWADLVGEVIQAGLCTGCAGCVISCPRGVLELDTDSWQPVLGGDAGEAGECVHGLGGCTMCTRACPRLRAWETDADVALHGRHRTVDEVIGIHRAIKLVTATDPAIRAAGQDGGFATAAMLYALEHHLIDAALVSGVDDDLNTYPVLATDRDTLVGAAGSRYTYSATTLAYREGIEAGHRRMGLVSVGCQASIPAVAGARGARKLRNRLSLVIGLLCCETFVDSVYEDLLEAGHGVSRAQVGWTNIKGKFQVFPVGAEPGAPPSLEVPLPDCAPYKRPGCEHCPDFTAQHADISVGGIGSRPKTTVAIVRTDAGEQLLAAMEADGWVTVEDAEVEDPKAVALIRRLAVRQRSQWTAAGDAATARPEPGLVPG